jgi:hypothetical protein
MQFKEQWIILNNRTISFREARRFFSGAVNTMRFLTISDPDICEPFIPAAAHRFGNRASAPVDNLVAGGMTP